MDWNLIAKEVIGWAIPVILSGVLAIYFAPLRNALKKGKEIESQEEWDAHAANLRERVEALEKDDQTYTKKLDDLIVLVGDNQTAMKTYMKQMDAKNTEVFIQIYQRDLIVDGKQYIANQKITPHQLANYEKRFAQYKKWGGNGDVDPWIAEIRRLPVAYPKTNT